MPSFSHSTGGAKGDGRNFLSQVMGCDFRDSDSSLIPEGGGPELFYFPEGYYIERWVSRIGFDDVGRARGLGEFSSPREASIKKVEGHLDRVGEDRPILLSSKIRDQGFWVSWIGNFFNCRDLRKRGGETQKAPCVGGGNEGGFGNGGWY